MKITTLKSTNLSAQSIPNLESLLLDAEENRYPHSPCGCQLRTKPMLTTIKTTKVSVQQGDGTHMFVSSKMRSMSPPQDDHQLSRQVMPRRPRQWKTGAVPERHSSDKVASTSRSASRRQSSVVRCEREPRAQFDCVISGETFLYQWLRAIRRED